MDGLPGIGGPHIELAGVPFEGVIRGCFLFTGERLIPRGGVRIRAGRVAAILGPEDADPAGGDFHLKSTTGRWDAKAQSWVKDNVHSPGIDAGDPKADFSKEPTPNGGRINLGAYGNTSEASKSMKN